MPRKKSYRRGPRPRRVRVAGTASVGALAAKDVIVNPITAAASDTYRLLSAKLSYQWADIQATIDDGLEFGLAHSDYTATEIEECLESQAAIDLGDKVAQEQSNRLVRSVGRISGLQEGQVGGGGVQFNGGRPIKTKLNWKMSIGDLLSLWIRNGSGVIYTTGSAVLALGDMWIVDA